MPLVGSVIITLVLKDYPLPWQSVAWLTGGLILIVQGSIAYGRQNP